MSAEQEARTLSGRVIPVQRVQADKKDADGESLPTGKAQAVDRVQCRAGDQSCAAAHASSLSRATASRPSLARASLLQLQQQYGNRYVERVLSLSREAEVESAQTPSHVEAAIESKRGGGQHLDNGVRRQMEGALGADLSSVRVHTDAHSDGLNRDLNARAFTTGQDVFFSHGAYQPGSSTGRELIAHELTHVVQQSGGEVRRAMTVSQPGDPHEVQAEETARAIMHAEHAQPQRQPEAHHKDEEEEKKHHGHLMKASRSASFESDSTE